ncbi:UDP-N-acetylmuramoyl-L-alanine--D-glutamate ligase [Arsenophonus symbiont of Ornithomya chloropus]|uniref:UDP-N-acetylmuramoyl-L-alanine--D-glutamate ligase n=1 Tax=Arsenophonus symbiont of Ornithomya chloropus TaxID=634121 RepID=UPI0032B2E498
MVNYYGMKIVIVGLGKTGFSCVNFFLSRKVIPRVIDTRIIPPYKDNLSKKIMLHSGSFNKKWLMSADLIVVSPGISLYTPELQMAVAKNIEIISDIEIFCREINKPIICITGSNGKSTVATLVAEMAKVANYRVGLGGNIGIPVLTLLDKEYDLYVLELSSFQLETTFSLKSMVATILNITENHMDRYPGGFTQYCTTKLKIYNNAKLCVINKQDQKTWPSPFCHISSLSFGVNTGTYTLNTFSKTLEIKGVSIIETKKIRLIGQHNYLNILAALALSDAIGIPRKSSLIALTEYEGLPHRLQLIYEHQGIKYINDSKATNVNSTTAALKSLKVSGKLYLLLGGQGKSADFSKLQSYVSDKNIQLCCFGSDGYRLAKLRSDSLLVDTIEQCLQAIIKKVKSGDVVLLSPACASFDQFHNFEKRGEKFTKLVKKYINVNF